jgi:hypothetical protein
MQYASGSKTLFACIGVADQSLGVKSPGNGFHIFHQDHLVVPVFKLKMQYASTASAGVTVAEGLLQSLRPPQVHTAVKAK